MTEPGSSMTKFRIILDLMFSPMGKMIRSAIIENYTSLSNKGIYRHIRDLESQKIIKEVKERGRKTVIVLNMRSQDDLVRIFEYLLNTNRKLTYALNRAFAECFLCAYGDFPFDSYADPQGKWSEKVITAAIMEKKRPDLAAEQVNEILEIASRIRGDLTVKFKLMYAWTVDAMIQEGRDSGIEMKQKYALLSLAEKSRPYIEDPISLGGKSPETVMGFLKRHLIKLARMVDNPALDFLGPNVNPNEEFIMIMKLLFGKEKGETLESLLESHWKYMGLEEQHTLSDNTDGGIYLPLKVRQSFSSQAKGLMEYFANKILQGD